MTAIPTEYEWKNIDLKDFKVGDRVRSSTDFKSERIVKSLINGTAVLTDTNNKGKYNWHGHFTYQILVTNKTQVQEQQWEDIDFKDFKVGDNGKSFSARHSVHHFIVTKSWDGNHLTARNIDNQDEVWILGKRQYKRLIVDKIQPKSTEQLMALTDKWSILRSVFVPDERVPKQISDNPHKCPFCKSPSYNHQVKIECTCNCEESRKTH